jgi:hypothetical protein
MKTCWRVEIYRHSTLALDVGEWSALCPGLFVPVKNPMCALYMSLAGPKIPFGCCGTEKYVLSLSGMETIPSSS